MKTILIIDTETTGLDHAKDAIAEVAWARYSLPERAVLESFSFLVDPRTYRDGTTEVRDTSALTGITRAMWEERGRAWSKVHQTFLEACKGVDAVVAHNATFDRKWFGDEDGGVPWVCTLHDVTWPSAACAGGKSLVATALAHGVAVTSAHRALTDVLLLASLLTRVAKDGHDVPAMLARGLRPKATFELAATDFDETRNAQARESGFKWDKDAKRWRRTMAVEDAEGLPFAVRRVA